MNSLKRLEPPYIFNNVDNRVELSKKKVNFKRLKPQSCWQEFWTNLAANLGRLLPASNLLTPCEAITSLLQINLG